MKILSIGTDRDLFVKNSEVRQRMIEYGNLVNEFYIIVFSRRNGNLAYNRDRKYVLSFENVRVYPTNSRNRWFYIMDAVRIGKKIIQHSTFNIQHSLITAQDPFECGLAGWLLKRKFKIPLQLQIHTDFLSPYFRKESLLNYLRVLIAKFLIPRANCIRVVSQRVKKSLLQVTGYRLQVVVLPIFVDSEKVKNAPVRTDLHKKYPQFDFIILMAGRLTKEKNIEMAINAMSDIVGQYPKTGLIIVGSGPEREALKLQVTSYKLQDNIKIEPWTDDLISYYKTADLFLLASNYEGYGRTLVEASAAGCNIISSDVGIADEILDQENIFKPGNKTGLQEKIINAINNQIKPPKPLKLVTKQEYLRKYKESWCNL
jgi:glycosyltransferase involved in cell wall biosynthesis